MKVCVSSTGTDLESQIDQRFGRCAYFLIIDTETMECQAIENSNVAAAGGAGINAAKNAIDAGALAVITGNCGPNAVRTLMAENIKLYTGQSGSVRQAIENLSSGKITTSEKPNVESRFGSR